MALVLESLGWQSLVAGAPRALSEAGPVKAS